VPDTTPKGVPGLEVYSGYVSEEQHPKLRGKVAMRVYEEMAANDATIGACLYVIESFLRRVDYGVVPANDSAQARDVASFVETCMQDMDQSWDEFISDVMSFLVYGFSLHEVVYKVRRGTKGRTASKYSDGKVGWAALSMRAQRTIERWDISPTGEILAAYQWAPTQEQETRLPMSRCLLFRTRSYKNNPEGVSMLRRAYRAWNIKKRLEEIEAIGIARDLNGLPCLQVPPEVMAPNATPAQRAVRSQAEKMVRLISRDQLEGVVLPAEVGPDNSPTGYKLSLLSTTGGKQMMSDAVVRRYDARIATTLAAGFIMLGTEKTGSYAMAAEKSSEFTRSLDWYAWAICDVLNRVAIPRLMAVNAIPQELTPKIEHSPVSAPEIRDLGLFLQQVATAGLLTPTPEVEAALREVAQLPPPNATERESITTRTAVATESDAAPEGQNDDA